MDGKDSVEDTPSRGALRAGVAAILDNLVTGGDPLVSSMVDAPTPRFTCPFCNKAFHWKSQQAGRKITCPQCHGMSRVPAESGFAGEPVKPPLAPLAPSGEADDYALDLPDSASTSPVRSAPVHQGKCPSCNAPVKPAAVLCINCGYHLIKGEHLHTTVGSVTDPTPTSSGPRQRISADKLNSPLAQMGIHRGVNADALAQDMEAEQRWKAFKLPWLLVLAGVILMLFNAGVMAPLAFSVSYFSVYTSDNAWTYGIYRLVYAGIRLAIQVPAMLVGIMIVAKLFGSSFGMLGTTLLKLTAIVLITGGASDFLSLGLDYMTSGWGALIGGFFLWAFDFGVFYVFCIALLDTEPLETIVLYVIVAVGPAFLTGFLAVLIWSLFG